MIAFIQPQTKYRGYVFDCDGTLADSMPLHLEAWNHGLAAAKAPFRIDGGKLMGVAGMDVRETVEHWNALHDLKIDPEITAHEKFLYFQKHSKDIKPIEPVVAFARECREAGAVLSVASGGSRNDVESTLAHLGIRHLFSAVITADDVERSKPHPDLFLLAAARMGVAPEDCLVIEDSPLGIQAANRAGMASVLIPSTV